MECAFVVHRVLRASFVLLWKVIGHVPLDPHSALEIIVWTVLFPLGLLSRNVGDALVRHHRTQCLSTILVAWNPAGKTQTSSFNHNIMIHGTCSNHYIIRSGQILKKPGRSASFRQREGYLISTFSLVQKYKGKCQ